MTQENKDFLLKDLCARLPYGIKALNKEEIITIRAYIPDLVIDEVGISHTVEDCKPYLFPLSSMTTEQRYELHDLIHNLNVLAINGEIGDWVVSSSEVDWYNKNHFDYRGLIPKDLAIDATGKNIY